MRPPDALRRAIRTFFQAAFAMILLQLAPVMLGVANGTWVPDVDWLQRVALSALVAGSVSLITWAHNALEDNVPRFPAILKANASDGKNPVTVDPAT